VERWVDDEAGVEFPTPGSADGGEVCWGSSSISSPLKEKEKAIFSGCPAPEDVGSAVQGMLSRSEILVMSARVSQPTACVNGWLPWFVHHTVTCRRSHRHRTGNLARFLFYFSAWMQKGGVRTRTSEAQEAPLRTARARLRAGLQPRRSRSGPNSRSPIRCQSSRNPAATTVDVCMYCTYIHRTTHGWTRYDPVKKHGDIPTCRQDLQHVAWYVCMYILRTCRTRMKQPGSVPCSADRSMSIHRAAVPYRHTYHPRLSGAAMVLSRYPMGWAMGLDCLGL
jgi:hypothetical protein